MRRDERRGKGARGGRERRGRRRRRGGRWPARSRRRAQRARRAGASAGGRLHRRLLRRRSQACSDMDSSGLGVGGGGRLDARAAGKEVAAAGEVEARRAPRESNGVAGRGGVWRGISSQAWVALRGGVAAAGPLAGEAGGAAVNACRQAGGRGRLSSRARLKGPPVLRLLRPPPGWRRRGGRQRRESARGGVALRPLGLAAPRVCRRVAGAARARCHAAGRDRRRGSPGRPGVRAGCRLAEVSCRVAARAGAAARTGASPAHAAGRLRMLLRLRCRRPRGCRGRRRAGPLRGDLCAEPHVFGQRLWRHPAAVVKSGAATLGPVAGGGGRGATHVGRAALAPALARLLVNVVLRRETGFTGAASHARAWRVGGAHLPGLGLPEHVVVRARAPRDDLGHLEHGGRSVIGSTRNRHDSGPAKHRAKKTAGSPPSWYTYNNPVWWRRAVLPSLPWVVCFLSFFLLYL